MTQHGERDSVAGDPKVPSVLGALLRTARPRQWTKNLLVAAAPAAGGELAQPEQLGVVALAFLVFCMASSGTYFLNDLLDAAADRLHPVKRTRPIAAGHLGRALATVVAVGLLVGAPLLAALSGRPALLVVVLVYEALTVSYSVRLKHLPVVELLALSTGFLLRAIAGGAATGVELSDWFLLVAAFGALFVVTGKRHAELVVLGTEVHGAHRQVLAAYSLDFCRYVLSMAAAVVTLTYCLWALEARDATGPAWLTFSVAPFLAAFLRYGQLVLRGEGGEPEELFLRDRPLALAGAIWTVLFVLGVYGVGW